MTTLARDNRRVQGGLITAKTLERKNGRAVKVNYVETRTGSLLAGWDVNSKGKAEAWVNLSRMTPGLAFLTARAAERHG
jgi:hypothetical protein